MRVPNWIHHSKKDPKRKLKPHALRQAKELIEEYIEEELGINS